MLIRVETNRNGKNWNPGLFLNLAEATGADVVKFLRDVVDMLAKEEVAMERMANAEGRTTQHPLYEAVGTVTLDQK